MTTLYPELRERQQPYRLMHDVYVMLDYGDRLVLDEFGLTTTQYRLLNLIDAAKGLRLTKLAERLIRSKSQITRTVATLEQMGLVRSLDDGSDGRALLVTLTPKGEKLRDQANKEHAKSLHARFSFLTISERHTLAGLLDKLQHGMAKYLEVE